MKRLAGQTGTIVDVNEDHSNDNEERLTRRAILFHEGTFQSQDGEISFDAERIQTIVDNHNAKITALAEQYGGIDKMPMGAYPPILDQHEDNSTDKIRGRLASLLKYEVRDIPGVGVKQACATADIVFLGRDTVDKVKDGRIYHLSIGIDEATNTLGETSTVIEPACPGAMVLKKGNTRIGAVNNGHKIKSGSKGPYRYDIYTDSSGSFGWLVTSPTGIQRSNGQDYRSQDEAERGAIARIEAAESGDPKYKMSNLKGGTEQMSANILKKQRAKLSAIKEALSKITTTAAATNKHVKLEKRKAEITQGFKRLMASGKLTPAEFKKMDLVKLAALDSEIANTVLATLDAREPVIIPGQVGSANGINFSDIGKSLEADQRKRLRAEFVDDMKRLGKSVKLSSDGASTDDSEPKKKIKETGTQVNELKAQAQADSTLAEGDQGEAQTSSLDAMQSQIDELNTQVARIAGMVDELMTSNQDDEDDNQEATPEAAQAAAAATEATQ